MEIAALNDLRPHPNREIAVPRREPSLPHVCCRLHNHDQNDETSSEEIAKPNWRRDKSRQKPILKHRSGQLSVKAGERI